MRIGLAWLLCAALAAGMIMLSPAFAQFDTDMCKPVAELIGPVPDYRDTGANVDKVVELVRKRLDRVSLERFQAIEREIRRAFRSSADRTTIEMAVYSRCIEGLGTIKRRT